MAKIKILAISARYPPYHFGGYELRVKDILNELELRGHEIRVITTLKEGHPKSIHTPPHYEIIRKLHKRNSAKHFIDELIIDLRDTAFLDLQIKRFQPDVIYLGHMEPFSKALMPFLAECKIPIVYDEGGMGLIFSWQNRGRWFFFIGEYISRFSILNKIQPFVIKTICKASRNRIKSTWAWPDEMQIIFNSELNLRNTIAKRVSINKFKVIHSGVDTFKFNLAPRTKLASPPLVIVVGRIEQPKGQKDAVHLLAKLIECGLDVNMMVVGEKYSMSYCLEIENEIKEQNLEGKIFILPMLPQDQLIDLYHKADFCFFPSYHKTGYSRVPLEAMACGCMVISYGNEGSDEIIRNELTGFLVRPRDYMQIVDILKRIYLNPEIAMNVVNNARNEIEANCSLQKYINEIEEILVNTASVN